MNCMAQPLLHNKLLCLSVSEWLKAVSILPRFASTFPKHRDKINLCLDHKPNAPTPLVGLFFGIFYCLGIA